MIWTSSKTGLRGCKALCTKPNSKTQKRPASDEGRTFQLVDISELGLNSKIKKFSYSSFAERAILPLKGENSFFVYSLVSHRR